MKSMFKRPRTYILLFLAVIIGFAGYFGYDYYQIYKMATNPESEEVGEAVENPFDKIEDVDEDSEEEENTEPAGSNSANKQNNSNNSGNNANAGTNQSSKQQSYDQIAGVYKSRFASLEAKQQGRLNSLVGQAKAEYANGASKMQIGAKYLNKANQLESQSEAEFNQLKNQLRNELTQNSYDTSIINEIESYYKYKKRAVKAEMFTQIQ